MRLRLYPAVALALLLPSPPSARALTADEVVARHGDALGGAARRAKIQSLRLTGKAIFGFGDFQFETAWAQLQKRPGMVRTETTLKGLTAVEAYDRRGGWSLDPFQGRRDAEKNTADEAKLMAQNADIEGPLVGWRAKGHRVE